MEPIPMTRNAIKSKVIDIISTDAFIEDGERLDLDANLEKVYGIDSLDAIDMTFSIENEFGITISDDEIEKNVTANAIIETVYNKLKKKGL